MLPKRPTFGTAKDCFKACGLDPDSSSCDIEGLISWCCYSNGCWICSSSNLTDCVWDPGYPGGPPLGGVFETGGVFTTGGTLGTGGVLSGGVFVTS
jgi:hypothetical protein